MAFILPVFVGTYLYYDYKDTLKELECSKNRCWREQNAINREIFEYEKYNSNTYVKEFRRIEKDEICNLSKLEEICNERPKELLPSPINVVNPFGNVMSGTELAKKKVLMYYDYLEKNDLKKL